MDEVTRARLLALVAGDLGFHQLERYLKHACDFGEREGPARDLWCLMDEMLGVASSEGRAIAQDEHAQVVELARGIVSDGRKG